MHFGKTITLGYFALVIWAVFSIAEIAELIGAVTCDMIAALIFLNYHFTIWTHFEPVPSRQKLSQFSLTPAFVLNL